jgi:hypothetical protein
MNKSTDERLRDAEERARQAALRVKALKTERSREQRRHDAKRKVILGAWLMANRPDLVETIQRSLHRPQDRAAFGLNVDIPLPIEGPAGESGD